jgi:glycine dehydrogenase
VFNPLNFQHTLLISYSIKTSWRRGARNGVRHSTEDIPSKLKYLFSPICVAKHLAPFLPSHPITATGGERPIDAVSAAPWGSASILLISWAYIKMLGGQGLVDSSKIALLSANYMAHRLSAHYSLRYKNANGRVAHELLIDFAEFDQSAGLKVTDFAKRLQVSGD